MPGTSTVRPRTGTPLRPGTGREGQVIPRSILEPPTGPQGDPFGLPSPTQGIQGLPAYDNVPVDDPMYEGQPVPQGQSIRVGKVRGQCVITIPATTGRKKLGQQVVIARVAQRIAIDAYRQGFNHGYASAQSPIDTNRHCIRIRTFVRWMDTRLKQALLSQDPSFPRKKSKTGVTRTGRRRKGPG